ncbi:MAG: glycosyltransferase [Burkholderiaceae bacterium]|nr:glycosyltransferase [Burkholderiaceae bacterium]
MIIAGEVVEHVWDYCKLLNDLKRRLNSGGCLIITTPNGRWEHSGTVAFRSFREHLHHFERADIDDICRGHDLEVLHAPAGHDRADSPLGSWVWCVWPNETIPLWKVDYERKLAQYAPRQSISACLIVKDGERTLRRCVESFIDWVDEVILCIDPATTDRTALIAEQLAEDYPNRPVRWKVGRHSALRDGFEAARNESIEEASGDWILWVDADEEIRRPWLLHKLARPSMHNGYGFPQVHYSTDPDTVLTTDYPCRFFRNRIGVRFYGMVHEHPEQELGKAVHYSLVRPEVKFLHHGYFDEETRRARYERNLPLLQRDIEKYPDSRPLNKFLLLRDIAQGIQFDAERRGPQPQHVEQAKKGISLMEQIVEQPQMKMISDAMQYYSLCVATTGGGFDAEISMRTLHGSAPDLAVTSNIKGRFHSRDFYMKVLHKLSQESTKQYEDRYL